jgi:2-phosphoglycerate kinase
MNTITKIILIGGPQATGKTTLAQKVSTRLNIPWISTDQIRTICGIKSSSTKEGLEAEIENNEEIWKGVERFIRSPFPWENIIIEGVAILPHLVASLDIKVNPVFIIDTDKTRIADVIYERSLLPWIKTKTDEQQEAKVAYILEFNDFIKQEAEKYNFPIVEISKTDEDVEKAVQAINL